MPITRRPRRTIRRRRPLRKRPIRRTRKMGLRRPVRSSIPEHQYCKLIYYTGQIGATTTTTPAQVTYYINDIFDLKNDSSYKQPRFFDQMASLYQKYRVNAVKYEFDFAPLSGSSYVACGFFPASYGGTGPDRKAFEEDPRWRLSLSSTNRGPIKIKGYKSIAAIEDVPTRVVRDDDSYNAKVIEAPFTKPEFRIAFQALDETQSYGHWLNGRLTFYTTFYQLKQPAIS